ncbi:MAG: type II toxin-antitoxin system VapC family toxin [Gemmatimonadota bacterium]|uniref:type II toxin-antitoxin system VapC family toxin n=1 Tax=Candidatus Palauibacter scopulicola TaxID=3056741 RepID=UPI002382E430|nr:type II toxin-antitoxin system VapC family toxin [Candidatus Palauibacter scopulicola]MDE2664139.1 type II toxin-antitoxin system VapC family toxin [Candidatus Palauibacter scopulicola]
MFLLDTDVLSELRRPDRTPAIANWLSSRRTVDLHLSVVSIGEIERGIARQRARDAAFAEALASWLDRVLRLYGDRILGIDAPTARRWGHLSASIGHQGADLLADLLIAATALEHGLTVVTRNVGHYEPTGVSVLDPTRPPSE